MCIRDRPHRTQSEIAYHFMYKVSCFKITVSHSSILNQIKVITIRNNKLKILLPRLFNNSNTFNLDPNSGQSECTLISSSMFYKVKIALTTNCIAVKAKVL